MLPFQVDPNWYEHYWYSPAKQQTVRREQRARKLLTSFLQAGYVDARAPHTHCPGQFASAWPPGKRPAIGKAVGGRLGCWRKAPTDQVAPMRRENTVK